LKQKANQLRRLVNGLQSVLENIVPMAEKTHYALSFHNPNVSLIVCFVILVVCLTVTLLLMLFPAHWIVFFAGLIVFIPLVVNGLMQSMLGDPVVVYELSIIEARVKMFYSFCFLYFVFLSFIIFVGVGCV
jgi:hypothetical protein